MCETDRISSIRKKEQESHIAMYSRASEQPWLRKPVKSVMELLPLLEGRAQIRILDLGCGIGRNCIPIAQYFHSQNCRIDCVDILDLAIAQLEACAKEQQVEHIIHGVPSSIDDFSIKAHFYDYIIAVSALEHVATKSLFLQKLCEIRDGLIPGGIVCLVLNSSIREIRKQDGSFAVPQFEVNLTATELLTILNRIFDEWHILKNTQSDQRYDIPRGDEIHILETSVITFAAQKR